MATNPASRLTDAGRWVAARAYATLAVNHLLRTNRDDQAAVEGAINRAARESMHIGLGFDVYFSPTIDVAPSAGAPPIDATNVGRFAPGIPILDPNTGQPIAVAKPAESAP